MILAVPRLFGWRPALAAPRAALALTATLLLAACSSAGATPSPATAPPGESTAACPTSQPDPLPASETRTVTIETDKGAIAIKIEADLSPIAAGNFVALAACGYYDGVVFHRVVPGFVIQGGDPTGTGTGGPGYEIQDEPVTATYGRGTVAMARTTQPNSVGSQFFIVLDDAARSALASANTYQIIGTVSSGMDAVDSIASAADAELPSDPVVMTKVTVSNP
jgi:cyclophilin family peptidyl-prolyl cis-trans isomerase